MNVKGILRYAYEIYSLKIGRKTLQTYIKFFVMQFLIFLNYEECLKQDTNDKELDFLQ